MEKQQQTRAARFFFGLVVLLGQASLASGLEAKLSLDNDRFVVGQKFSVDLLVNNTDSSQVTVTQPTYPPALELTGGPLTRQSSWTDSAGQTVQGTKLTLSFQVMSSGIISLGPFTLAVGSQTLVVPARPLYLLAKDEAQNRFPLEVRWKVPPGPYFQGQDIPVFLQVRNLENLVQPHSFEVPAPANTLWEKAEGLGEIEITAVGDDRILNLPWATWMMIPTQTGQVILPSVAVNVGGLVRQAPSMTLDIAPMPPQVADTRALGDFSYVASVSRDGLGLGQFAVIQEVRGRGNFPYLVFPMVELPGLRLVSQHETQAYRPTSTGYQGSLSQTWIFSAEKPGTVRVNLPGFIAYQPSLDKVWTWDPRVVSVSASAPGALSAPAPRIFEPLTAQGVVSARPWNLYTDPAVWLFFLPGPLLFLAGFWIKSRRGLVVLLPLIVTLLGAVTSAPDNQKQALLAWNSGQFDKAFTKWQALTVAHPTEPGYWYNLGLAAEKTGQTAEAVRDFHNALSEGFQGDLAIQALGNLEKQEQLTDQFSNWSGLDPSWFFFVIILAWNALFFFVFLARWTKRVAWIMPASLCMLLFVGSIGVLWFAVSTQSQVSAVVGPSDAPIHRVPGPLSEDWLTLRKGTSVHYRGFSGGYALVVTGWGLDGWVKLNYLLTVDQNSGVFPRF